LSESDDDRFFARLALEILVLFFVWVWYLVEELDRRKLHVPDDCGMCLRSRPVSFEEANRNWEPKWWKR